MRKKFFSFLITSVLFLGSCSMKSGNKGTPANAPVFLGLSYTSESVRLRNENNQVVKELLVGSKVDLTVTFDNPEEFEILSFVINSTKFSSYMFLPGSDLTNIFVTIDGSDVEGDFDYKISQIKYIDGESIHNVKMQGNDIVTIHFYEEEVLPKGSTLDIFTGDDVNSTAVERFVRLFAQNYQHDFAIRIASLGDGESIVRAVNRRILDDSFDSCLIISGYNIATLGSIFNNKYVVDFSDLISSTSLELLNQNVLNCAYNNEKLSCLPLAWAVNGIQYDKISFSNKYGDDLDSVLSNYGNMKSFFNDVNTSWNNDVFKAGYEWTKDLILENCLNNDVVIPSEITEENIRIIEKIICDYGEPYKNSNDNIDFKLYTEPNIDGASAVSFSFDHSSWYLDVDNVGFFLSKQGDKYLGKITNITYLQDSSISHVDDDIDAFVSELCDAMIKDDSFLQSLTYINYVSAKKSLLSNNEYIENMVNKCPEYYLPLFEQSIVDKISFNSNPLTQLNYSVFAEHALRFLFNAKTAHETAVAILDEINQYLAAY